MKNNRFSTISGNCIDIQIIFLFVIGFFIVSVFSRPVHAGNLKGKIESSKEFQEFLEKTEDSAFTDKEDYYWLIENGVLPINPPTVDWSSEVTIAIMKKKGPAGAAKIQTIIISGAALNPALLIVPPKSTIKFKNEDPFVHSIYSPDLGQSFAPELLPSRQLRQVQFLNPGKYTIRCKMTPHLEGYVIVDPQIIITTSPAKDATFLFENLAPGKYQMKIFYRDQEVGSQEVEIIDDKKDVEVEIKLQAPKKPETEEGEEEKKEQEKGDEKAAGKPGEKKGGETGKASGGDKGVKTKKALPSKGKK